MNESSSTRVILNPAASGGRGARLRPGVESILAERGLSIPITETSAPGDARALARGMAREKVERILVVGGDGTIHEVANGVLEASETPPALGILPVGTGNDFFRMVGSRRDISQSIRTFLEGKVRWFDVGRVSWDDGDCVFVNLLGVGIDVLVLEKREGFQRLRGLPQYLAAFAAALSSFHPERFRISIQGAGAEETPGEGEWETIDERTILTAVTVGPSVGGGFMLNPEASPYDGLLDLFFVEVVGLRKIARLVPRVIRGTHGSVPEIRLRRLVRGTLERSDGRPFFFELDGERMPDPATRLRIQVSPAVLPVLVGEEMP